MFLWNNAIKIYVETEQRDRMLPVKSATINMRGTVPRVMTGRLCWHRPSVDVKLLLRVTTANPVTSRSQGSLRLENGVP
jgi:hypothetical protein